MNLNGSEIKNTNCLAGRMDAISYLKTKALPGIIKRAENNSGKSTGLSELELLTVTLEFTPGFSDAFADHMDQISETAIRTKEAAEVAKVVMHTQTLVGRFNHQKVAA